MTKPYPTVDEVSIAIGFHDSAWGFIEPAKLIQTICDLDREHREVAEVIPWAEYPWAKWAALYNSETIIMAEYEIFLDGRVWKWVNETGRAEFVDIPKQKPDLAASLRARPENV